MSTIEFDYQDKHYTLEFDRSTAAAAERRYGISLNEVLDGKLTYLPPMFAAAFLKHHPRVPQAKIDEIYDQMGDKQGLMEGLLGMYAETVMTLMEEPEEGKAISWALS